MREAFFFPVTLFIAGAGGLVFTLLYMWRRKLWINIIGHFVVDGVSVLLG